MAVLKNCFITLLIICAVSGCKTVKNNIRESYVERKEMSADIKEETTERENIVTTEERWINELANIVEKTITEKFTTPDSAGKQYIIEKTTKDIEIIVQRSEIGTKAAEIETTILTEKNENIYEVTNIKNEKIDKTVTKISTPAWVIVAVAILCVGILIIVILFLKKYRII